MNAAEFDVPDDVLLPDQQEVPAHHRSGFVAVVGRPNVGKSTFLNQILGQKIAIVSSKPQTTRNQLLGILTMPDETGYTPLPDAPPAQIIFVDTPGLHKPRHKLGEFLVDEAQAVIPDADIVLWLVDASQSPNDEDRMVAQILAKHVSKGTSVMLLLNKVDLISPDALFAAEATYLQLFGRALPMPISAATGLNLSQVLWDIVDHLPLGPLFFPPEQVTDQQVRFIAGELIREAALNTLRDEVPHALAVEVIEFKERSPTLTYISANLIIERTSQKKIVIGEKGRTLKHIGRTARPQIEELLDTQVYLELWVKVRPKWRKNESQLRWLGYSKRK